MLKAVIPGTFDPFTHGHADIVRRAQALFGSVMVAVAESKRAVFTQSERCAMVQAALLQTGLQEVSVLPFDGLLINFMRRLKADIIVRGVRDSADLAHEHTQYVFNADLAPEITTVWLPCALPWLRLSASAVRTLAAAGGDCRSYVSPFVDGQLRKLYNQSLHDT